MPAAGQNANTKQFTIQFLLDIQDGATAVLKNVQGQVQNVARGVENVAKSSTSALQSSLGGLSQGFTNLGTAATTGIQSMTGGLDPLNTMMGTLNAGVGTLQGKLASFGGVFGGLVAAVPIVLGLGAATQFLTKSLQDASTETQNFLQLQAGWKALSRGSTDDMTKFTDAVKALSRTSTYASQDVIGAAKTLTGFGNIATKDLLPALQVVIDTAAYMGTDIRQAAQIVGYAARGEFGMLREWGFQFSEATKQSRNFQDILREMGTRVAGQEAAKMETYAGAVGSLTKAFNRVEKAVGHVIEAAAVPVIKDLAGYFGELGKQIEESFKAGGTEAWQAKVSNALQSVGDHLKRLFSGFVDFASSGGLERIFSGMMIVVGAVQTLVEWIGKLAGWFIQLPQWVHLTIAGLIGLKVGISILGSLQGLVTGLAAKVVSLVSFIPGIGSGFAALGGVAIGPLAAVVAAVGAMGVAVYQAASNWEDLTSFLKDDLGVIYDMLKKIVEVGLGPFKTVAEYIAKKAGLGAPEEKVGDPKQYQEYYYTILSTARVAGGTVADIERKMRAEISKSGAYTDEEKRNRLAGLQAANGAVIKEYIAHQEALKKVAQDQGTTLQPEVQEKYELRLAKAKAYFDELEQLQASAHEEERRKIWETAQNQEEAQLRIKQFNVQASIERMKTAEAEYQTLKQMREDELKKQIAKEEGTPNAAEREKELRQKAQEEDLKASVEHQKKIQSLIQNTEKQIQELYKERLDIVNKIADATVAGQKAIDAVTGKSRNEFANLQVSIQRANEETQKALDLLPQQPERALKFAESARQMWQSLAQDVNSLEKELRSTQDWYLNFYRNAMRERMSAPDKFQFDAQEALRLKEEAQKAYDAGDYRLAQERIRQARDLAATLYKEAPEQMKKQAIGIMEQVRGVDQTIGKTMLENAKTINANATKQIERLNSLVQDVWRIKMEQNTQALQNLTQALSEAKARQTELPGAPGELAATSEAQSSTSATMSAVTNLTESVKSLGDEAKKSSDSVRGASDQIKSNSETGSAATTGGVSGKTPPSYAEWLQDRSASLQKQIDAAKAAQAKAAESGDIATEDQLRYKIFYLEEKLRATEQARHEEAQRKLKEQWQVMSEAEKREIRRKAAARMVGNGESLYGVADQLENLRSNINDNVQQRLGQYDESPAKSGALGNLGSVIGNLVEPVKNLTGFGEVMTRVADIFMKAAETDKNINITVNQDGSVTMSRGGGQYDNW